MYPVAPVIKMLMENCLLFFDRIYRIDWIFLMSISAEQKIIQEILPILSENYVSAIS
jgi:hypothetical protein